MAELSTILENSNDMKEKWTTYLAFPYANAYASAIAQFKATKGAQDKLDANKAEYGLLALSICSGGVLTHVFAQTAWKAVVAEKGLSVICNKNWEKAFNVAHFASTNKVANFVVGGLWDTGANLLDTQTKNLFEQTTASFPSTQEWLTEIKVLTSLMGFVNECYLKYRDTARSLFSNPKLTAPQREEAVRKLTASKFANPPSKSFVKESTVAMEIELLLYLRIIMDLDYTQTFNYGVAGGYGASGGEGKKTGISALPGTDSYPKPYTNVKASPQGVGTVSGLKIGYQDLGRAFYDKTNSLYKSLGYGDKLLDSAQFGEMWNATMTESSFRAAYQALLKLETQGMHRFIQTVS